MYIYICISPLYKSALNAHTRNATRTHALRRRTLLPVWCADILYRLFLFRMVD